MDWVYVIFATLQVFQHGLSYECDSNPTCEIWLSVEEKLTMTWGKIRVYAKNSHLYRFDEDWRNATSKVNTDEVIVMDGIERAVIAVNNSIPGPPIIAYEGQELVVHVKNHLLSDAITIHWHGLHQRGSPFMDGVAYVTQCPIEAGQTFTYRFQAYPRGTFWYHSHIGGQRVDGLFGALIIKPKAKANSNTINDVIMHIGDWFHSRGSELHTKMIHGNFKSKPGFIHPKTLDGVYFAPATYKSSHIEGRGRYWDSNTGNWTETPLKNYYVEKGQQYRFRVIHPGTIFPLRVSIDDHLLEIIALDGYDVVPAFFESFIINPGERFDFILTANQSKHEYWIRVESMETDFTNHYVRGILRYDSGSTNDPTTQRMNCIQAIPCRVLNCQFSYYPKHMHTKCTRVDQLKAADTKEAKPSFDKDSIQLFQNWVQMGGGMGVNGILFEHPGVSSLTQPEEIRMDLNCDVANCGPGKICSCQHEIDIPYNKTIQMIWTNHGKGATRHHPIHLHGHSFYVLKLAYGVYNETTGLQIFDNSDINCSPSGLCNDPSFTDRSWHGDNIPGLNLINPPQKDTLMIPTGAYAVVRFRSDNPGKWFVHCHIEFHAMQGMSMILNEAKEQHISPPHGFPICSDFNYDSSLDKAYIRKDLIRYEDCKENLMFIVAVVIGALLVLENCCLLLLKCFRKYSSAGSLKTKYETKVHFKNKKCGGEGNTQKTVL